MIMWLFDKLEKSSRGHIHANNWLGYALIMCPDSRFFKVNSFTTARMQG